MKNRFSVVILLLIFIYWAPVTVAADQDKDTQDWSDEWGPIRDPNRIIRGTFSDENKVIVLPMGSTIEDVDLFSQATCFTNVYESNYMGEILWDYTSADLSKEGWHYIKGTVPFPKGSEFYYDGGVPTVKQAVLIYDPNKKEVETIINGTALGSASFILPYGLDEVAREAFYRTYRIDAVGNEGLRQFLERYGAKEGIFYIQDGFGDVYEFSYPVRYNASLVDMEREGSYHIFYGLPEYFIISPSARQQMSVHVIDPLKVDFKGWWVSGTGTISMSWFLELENPQAWVSVDGGEWIHMDEMREKGYLIDKYTVNGDWEYYGLYEHWEKGVVTSFQISEPAFNEGHIYEFELRYGEDGKSVNTFTLDLTKGHLLQYGSSGGSRGGSDREEVPEQIDIATSNKIEPTEPEKDAFKPTEVLEPKENEKQPPATPQEKEEQGQNDNEDKKAPVTGVTSILLVAAISATLTVAIWKLMGKRLVKH